MTSDQVITYLRSSMCVNLHGQIHTRDQMILDKIENSLKINEWIPVTERLPGNDDIVLITIYFCGETLYALATYEYDDNDATSGVKEWGGYIKDLGFICPVKGVVAWKPI